MMHNPHTAMSGVLNATGVVGDIFQESVTQAYGKAHFFVPRFFVAALVVAAGYVLGRAISAVAVRIFRLIQLEHMLERADVRVEFQGLGLAEIVSIAIRWYVYLIFITVAVGTFGVPTVDALMRLILVEYSPRIVQSALIVLLGIVVGEYVARRLGTIELPQAKILGVLTNILIVYVAVVLALPLLVMGVERSIVTLVLALPLIVVLCSLGLGLSLGMGLAIGLGSRDVVSELLGEYLSLHRRSQRLAQTPRSTARTGPHP